MQPTSKIFPLEGVIQHYSWGGQRFLPELLGKNNITGQPFAEYWMGAHENAPSRILLPDGSTQTLDAFIRQEANTVLGKAVSTKFGRLPYLFKILDVKDMLSIQVHPTKKAAEMEFAAENKKGIPVNAPRRNYKDDNYKPELMVAWSDFWLLHGFKPARKLEKMLTIVPQLNFLLPTWKQSKYEGIYKQVMQMDQWEVNKILQPLIDRILPLYETDSLKKTEEDFWAARAYKTFCNEGVIDRGLFSIYFFNVVNLKPGEAIFQDAGILHAYLEGQNLEIMANSDNVLRGGLTNKQVDVQELLKHVRFEPVEPAIIRGKINPNTGEEVFKTPAADFELRRLTLNKGKAVRLRTGTTDIFLVSEGIVGVTEPVSSNAPGKPATSPNEAHRLNRGEAMLAVNGADILLRSEGEAAVVFRATVPGE